MRGLNGFWADRSGTALAEWLVFGAGLLLCSSIAVSALSEDTQESTLSERAVEMQISGKV